MSALTTWVLQASGLGVEGEGIWLALGTIGMLLGMSYFMAKGWGVRDPEQKLFYVITIFIAAIAAASYLSMFFGFGLTEVELVNGQVLDIYWARYADWLFTTPLLLLDIALLAGADWRDIGALVGLDAFMIVTGLAATLMKIPTARYTFWTISTIAMIFLLYFLVATVGAAAKETSEEAQSTFRILRNVILVSWAIYPVAWLVGTEGLGIVGLFGETLIFMILDLFAKIGFGFILLSSRAVIGESTTPSSAADVDPSDQPMTPGQSQARFELYEDASEEWRWRLRHRNGNIIADSAEGYVSRDGVEDAVDGLREYVASADYLWANPTAVEVYRDAAGEFRWRLIHRNGNILADSGGGYSSRSGARRAVDRIQEGIDDMEFEVYEDSAAEFRWRLRGGNNRIMADSGEGYSSKSGAEDAVERVTEHFPEADTLDIGQGVFEIFRDKAGEFRWRFRHRNGNILADSGEGYSSRSGCRDGIESVKRNAPDAALQE